MQSSFDTSSPCCSRRWPHQHDLGVKTLPKYPGPVAETLMEAIDHTPLRRAGLSRREAEVLHWMSQGKRDKEIAIILGISYRTVTHHVSAILQKLGAETRTAAVAAAAPTVKQSVQITPPSGTDR